MDLRTLEYFLAVAREENITRAAEKLHISQPPLTRQLQQLEQELGVQLFVRGKRKTTLTPQGVFLQSRAEQLLDLAERTRQQVSNVQQEPAGRLYVGSIETAADWLLSGHVTEYRALHPGVNFSWWSGNSDDVASRLEKGLEDLAILRSPCDEEKFACTPLFREGWAAYMRPEDPLNALPGDTITIEQLARSPLIIPKRRGRGREIEGWFTARGLTPNICCDVSPFQNALALAQSGMGVAILPHSAARSLYGRDLAYKKIDLPIAETQVLLAVPKYETLSPLARDFCAFLRQRMTPPAF